MNKLLFALLAVFSLSAFAQAPAAAAPASASASATASATAAVMKLPPAPELPNPPRCSLPWVQKSTSSYSAAMVTVSRAMAFVQGQAAPWSVVKTDEEAARGIIAFALHLIRLYAVLSRPFIPDAAQAIMASLDCEDWAWPEDLDAALTVLPAGHAFTVPENLFRKITDEEREDWAKRFAGRRE